MIGASAGGVEALQAVASSLPAEFGAPVLVVLHLWPGSESFLPEILSRAGPLPAFPAEDGARLELNRIYVAVPNRHLLVQDGVIRVTLGPKENRHRPSIDVLFRSAARTWRAGVIGALLTGSDDDGAAGLHAISNHGGIAIVQDPSDSPFPAMPLSAMRYITPDHKLPLAGIGPAIARLVNSPVRKTAREVAMNEKEKREEQFENRLGTPDAEKIGAPSAYTCPDCGGTLWELHEDELLQYRCRVGHVFSPSTMLEAESDMVERALWNAVRTLQESASVNRRIAATSGIMNQDFLRRAEEREQSAKVIRDLLGNGNFKS